MGRLYSAAWILLVIAAPAGATIINFDVDGVDGGGNAVVAPTLFSQTTPLTTLYSPVGVTFSGPSSVDGGAILSGGGFGVLPRSAPNFLAFSRSGTAFMQNGGLPRDPETITFNTPLSSVSIYASGGSQSATFRLDAFDTSGNPTPFTSVTGTNTSGQYVQLSIPSPALPIKSIRLTEIGGDTAFVYDDLEYTLIPEPAALSLLTAAAGLLWRRRRC